MSRSTFAYSSSSDGEEMWSSGGESEDCGLADDSLSSCSADDSAVESSNRSGEENSSESPAYDASVSLESQPGLADHNDSEQPPADSDGSDMIVAIRGHESDYTTRTDSDSDENFVPQKRRNPHRAARDPSMAGEFDYAPPMYSLAAREAKLRAECELERSKRRQAEAEVARLKARYETRRGSLDEAQYKKARALSERLEALDTAAGAMSPGGAGSGADMYRVLHKPAAYEGHNETCHIVDWLVAMFHYLMTLRVPSSMFVTTASTYLRGEALRFWSNRQQTLTSREASDWETFREAMLERFDSENTAVTARIKLDHIKQGDMSMAKLVQKFDFVTSYISDMADADLIHRFLMAVSPECKSALQNDPSTGVRWTEYVKLRKYALNM